MRIDYICKPNLKLAIAVWDGSVTWDNWQAHLHRMFSDPAYAPMQIQITDLRFSSINPTISNDEIQAMRNLLADQRERISLNKVAIVAGDDWSKPKLAEFALQTISVNSIVFNDLNTACLWLGVNVVEVGQDIEQIRIKLRQNP
jgi:hypothetical protein